MDRPPAPVGDLDLIPQTERSTFRGAACDPIDMGRVEGHPLVSAIPQQREPERTIAPISNDRGEVVVQCLYFLCVLGCLYFQGWLIVRKIKRHRGDHGGSGRSVNQTVDDVSTRASDSHMAVHADIGKQRAA